MCPVILSAYREIQEEAQPNPLLGCTLHSHPLYKHSFFVDNRVNQFIMDFFNRHMNSSSDGTAFKAFVKDNIKNVGITIVLLHILFNYSFNLCGGLLNQIQ